MSDELDYRRVLDRSIIQLKDDMDPQPILDQFKRNDFLPYAKMRDIKEKKYTTDKNHAIIDSVRPKGIKGYIKFKDILRDSHQGDLADYLDEIEKEVKEDQKPKTSALMLPPRLDQSGHEHLSPQPNILKNQFSRLGVHQSEGQDIGRTDQRYHHGDEPSNQTVPQQKTMGEGCTKAGNDGDFVDASVPITDRIDDGRIQIEDVVWIQDQIKSNAEILAPGGTGNVYLLKDADRWGGKVVVKKIERHKNSNPIINEIVAAKIRHHAIVPLLARCNSDTNKFVHGDITSRNIVLDGNDNPRLLDFGIARELKDGKETVTVKSGDMIGTEGLLGYVFNVNAIPVIKEMLTGSKPIDDQFRRLQTEVIHPKKPRFAACYEKVWKDEAGVYNTLKKMAVDCLDRTVKVNASRITQDLYAILRDFNQESKTEALGDTKCSLCMLNRIDPDNANLYLQNCLDNSPHEAPPVCVACMRNSYLNPIQCMRCRQTIPTKIGYSWAAILITGYDKEEKYREAINKDVKEMKKILTSKHPLVTGLSEENVIITTLHGLSEAIHKLEECTTLFTVIVYYSGHHTANSGFQVDNFSMTTFECCLKAIKKEIILIMDCCFCPDLISSIPNIKLQLNASRPDEEAEFTSKGSTFTQVFVETLQRRSTDSCHKAKPAFISVVLLFEQIKKDMKVKQQGCGSTPTMNLTVTGFSDLFIGYTHYTTSIKFFYEDKDNLYFEVDILDTIKDLKAELLKEVLKDRYKEQFLENHGDTLTTYSDIIAITIRKGPHEVGIHELSSIEEVTRAWNQKFELSFGIRNVKNIHNNTKVGIFLDEIKTQDILQRYLMNIGGDIYTNTNETIVKVQWTQKAETMDKLYELKTTVEQTQDDAHQWLCDTLVDIDENHKIKGATHVVFTVPSGLWKKDENDFLTIELEGLALE